MSDIVIDQKNGNIHCVNIKTFYSNGQPKFEYSLYDAKKLFNIFRILIIIKL